MSFYESLTLALFGLGLVFLVLVSLSVIIGLQSRILRAFTKKKTDNNPVPSQSTEEINAPDISAGELRLYDVDEKTAAMIMAIVSDESKIPLSELRFKSIKALD
ncbi:MAG: OadG family protein [Clostridiaceae bacterium]|nr:OadG family protein [Clostridiaceae bacterium]